MKTKTTQIQPNQSDTVEFSSLEHTRQPRARCYKPIPFSKLHLMLTTVFQCVVFSKSLHAGASPPQDEQQIRRAGAIDGDIVGGRVVATTEKPESPSPASTTKEQFRKSLQPRIHEGQTASAGARIVGGGEIDPPLRYQYLASLFVSNRSEGELLHVCGGSLIEPNLVLSSAHCAKRNPDVIRIGVHDLHDTTNHLAEQFFVTEIITHPKYREDVNHYDFALFLLDGSSTFNTIKLNKTKFKPQDGAFLSVIGWGATQYGGPSSSVPMIAQVKSVPNKKCNEMYGKNLIKSHMMCAGADGTDACSGDSGGPLVVEGTKEDGTKDILVGIVSSGVECGLDNYPGVYARVSSVVKWIGAEVMALAPQRVEEGSFETDRMAVDPESEFAENENENGDSNVASGSYQNEEPSGPCKDNESFVGRKGQARQCDWVRKRINERCKDHWESCKKSCGKCSFGGK